MVALRSRRLETLFGAPLDALTSQHIHSLVTSTAQEAFDLDFKLTLYGRADADKRALAGDVAALANTAGGVIVIGVDEDEQARATGVPGVEVSDAEVARMRQVIASLVAPMPEFDILTVPDAVAGPAGSATSAGQTQQAAKGFLVIAVARSPYAPHAVLVNEGLRYPMRNGATTRYLSEPEVSTAYRNRFAAARRQATRVEEIEREAIARLNPTEIPWLVVSLVPDLPGDLLLSRETFLAFQQGTMGAAPTMVNYGRRVHRVRVGRRRLLADGTGDNSPSARWVSLELHTDGSGVFALRVHDIQERRRILLPAGESEPVLQLVDDEGVAIAILSGLMHLARHARDRAAAGGTALVRAQLFPVSTDRPTMIGYSRGFGSGEARNEQAVETAAVPAEAVAPLDDLAEPGPGLIAAAALLLDDLGQAFGVPEMGQLTRDGRLWRRYWGSTWQAQIVAWANQHGIDVTDEVLQ